MPNKKQSPHQASASPEPAQFDGNWVAKFTADGTPGLDLTVNGDEAYVENGGWFMDIVEFNPPLLRYIIRAYPERGVKEVNDVRKA